MDDFKLPVFYASEEEDADEPDSDKVEEDVDKPDSDKVEEDAVIDLTEVIEIANEEGIALEGGDNDVEPQEDDSNLRQSDEGSIFQPDTSEDDDDSSDSTEAVTTRKNEGNPDKDQAPASASASSVPDIQPHQLSTSSSSDNKGQSKAAPTRKNEGNPDKDQAPASASASSVHDVQPQQPSTTSSSKNRGKTPATASASSAHYDDLHQPGPSSSSKRTYFPLFDAAAKRRKMNPVQPTPKEPSTAAKRKKDRTKPLLPAAQVEKEVQEENVNKKKTPLKTRLSKFQNTWLTMENYKDWVMKSDKKSPRGDDMVECRYCGIFLKAHKGVLDNHRTSNIHAVCKESVGAPNAMDEHAKSPLHIKIRRFELKILALIASGNLSLSLLDTLVPLLQYLLPNVDEVQGMKLHHTRGTQLLHMMGEEFQEQLNEKLRKVLFSLIFDETTDCSSTKQMATAVTFFDEDLGAPVEAFFDMLEPKGGTAVEIAECLKTALEEKGISIDSLMGLCADTCNTNFGEHNSVTSYFQKLIPYLLILKCVCHLINLVSRKSFGVMPKAIDDMLHKFAKHFGKSPKQVAALKELQEFMGFEIHRILFLSGTRWLAHGQCVDRVLEQYSVLQKYFADLGAKFSGNRKQKEKLDFINSILQPPITKLYLQVSSHVLKVLDHFNKLFQKEVGLLFLLKPKLEEMMREICGWYIKKKDLDSCSNIYLLNHKDPKTFKPRESFYFGFDGDTTFKELSKVPKYKSDIDQFLNTVHRFYVEIISQLKSHFDFVFSDPFYTFIQITNPNLDPEKAMPSLAPIFNRFPPLNLLVDNTQETDREWRAYLDSNLIPSKEKSDKFWKQVAEVKNDTGNGKFANFLKVVNFLRSIPISNACVERIHSHTKLIKTPNRNAMKNKTLKSLLATKFGVKNVVEFEPSRNMLLKNIAEEKKKTDE